jgi:hypothetical protein
MKTKLVLAVLLVIFLSSTGFSQKLVYSTYVGGSAKDADMNWLKRFSIDPSGTIYFATSTYGTGFPVTDDAFGRMYNGGSAEWGEEDLAIVQFNIAQNQLKYASYFGGKSGPDFVSEVLLHKGSYYLVGNTGSKDFPVTEQDIQRPGIPAFRWLHFPVRRP